MGVAMYLIFGKLWKPTTRHRFVILLTIFILYILIGAYIFSLLNYPQEKLEINDLITFKKQFYLNYTCVNKDSLEDLLNIVIETTNKGVYYYDPNDTHNSSTYTPKWKFGGNTIFFTYTLLATIGYGHLAPYTAYGKLFCIFYIIFGVPMTLLLLSALTERLVFFIENHFFKRKSINTGLNDSIPSYSTFERKIEEAAVGGEINDSNEESSNVFPKAILYLKFLFLFFLFISLIYIIPAFILSEYTEEKWSYLDAIYYCFISLTTVGLGDYVPGNSSQKYDQQDIYRLLMTLYLAIGIISTTVITTLLTRITLIGTIKQVFSTESTNNTTNSEINNTQNSN